MSSSGISKKSLLIHIINYNLFSFKFNDKYNNCSISWGKIASPMLFSHHVDLPRKGKTLVIISFYSLQYFLFFSDSNTTKNPALRGNVGSLLSTSAALPSPPAGLCSLTHCCGRTGLQAKGAAPTARAHPRMEIWSHTSLYLAAMGKLHVTFLCSSCTLGFSQYQIKQAIPCIPFLVT